MNWIKKQYVQNLHILLRMIKHGRPFGKEYFEELLERIREIRVSERRAYQKIADVFEQTSSDYQSNSEITSRFYAFIQNKMHYAITGKAVVGIIHDRSDSEHPIMSLTTMKGVEKYPLSFFM